MCPQPFVWLSGWGTDESASNIPSAHSSGTSYGAGRGDYNSPSQKWVGQRKRRWGTGFWLLSVSESVSQCELTALSARTHKQYHPRYLPGVPHGSFPDDYQQLPASPRHASSPREPSRGSSFLRSCFRSKIQLLQVFAWDEARE